MPSFTAQIANLEMSGPIVEVLISPGRSLIEILKDKKQVIPQPVKVLSMIDTGATSSVIRSDIIEKIGLNPIGIAKISTPSTTTPVECYQYQAVILFPNILHGAINLHFLFPRKDAKIAKNTKTLRPLRLCERLKKTQFMPSLSIT